MPAARLPDRAVLKVAGAEARALLDRLVTCDLDPLAPGRPCYGALLTPQGKIIADFIAFDASVVGPGTILLDVAASVASELAKRLKLYRLRAAVAVDDVSADWTVLAGWGDTATPTGEHHLAAVDPRHPDLGWRALVPADGLIEAGTAEDGEGAYHAHRVALGVPEGGRDFAFGDAFPHEAVMDQLAGVAFDKGCYVGQEVVSRMQHRGTARTRVVSLAAEGGAAPAPGSAVTAGEKTLGTTGSAAGERALATIRLDRAADALASGEPILAGGVPVRLVKPGWARFPYPGESAGEAA